LVVFPARCISSISPRFYFRKHAFCLLPLVAILESPEQNFSKEEIQMAKKHIKKCSPSLAIKEMQIKTTLKFYLIPVTTTKNTTTNKCW
jgi:hypothetical protein